MNKCSAAQSSSDASFGHVLASKLSKCVVTHIRKAESTACSWWCSGITTPEKHAVVSDKLVVAFVFVFGIQVEVVVQKRAR